MKRRLDMASGLYHSLAAKGITLQVLMQKLLCLILKIWVKMITKIYVRTFSPLSVSTITPFYVIVTFLDLNGVIVKTPKDAKVRTTIFVIIGTHIFNIKHKSFCIRTCKVPLNIPIWLPDYQ